MGKSSQKRRGSRLSGAHFALPLISITLVLGIPERAWSCLPSLHWGKAEASRLEWEALRGDAEAQDTLATWYQYGWNGHEKNLRLAAKWFLRAAKRGNLQAQQTLGEVYEFGEGVRPNHEQALEWIQKAVVEDSSSSRAIALRYEQGTNAPQDIGKAIDWYRISAEAGDVLAQTYLGELYESGAGGQNFAEAARWYGKAAEKSYGRALSDLAHLYVTGKGVPQDYSQAVKLYHEAIKADGISGRYSLGLLYEQGLGVSKDLNRAMELYHAIAPYDSDARQRLFMLFEAELPLPHDQGDVIAWYRVKADGGDPRAQLGLGLHYQFGVGVTANWTVAYALFALAKRLPSATQGELPDFAGPDDSYGIHMNPEILDLVHQMQEPEHLLIALDEYIATPPPSPSDFPNPC